MKAPIHVIILAQGQQTRLPDLTTPKHLLPLPACGNAPIILRTLCQLAMMGHAELEDGLPYVTNLSVTVVCGGDLRHDLDAAAKASVYGITKRVLDVDIYELANPGNSSLKGISRYLDAQDGPVSHHPEYHPEFLTVVLLGDVVYSWKCLEQILTPTHWGCTFVGTSTLSRATGELWGLSWLAGAREPMLDALDLAMTRHPPSEDVYQCGQMRRWLWAMDDVIDGNNAGVTGIGRTWYRVCDDYTDDVDVPADIENLPDTALAAGEDDDKHELVWRSP